MLYIVHKCSVSEVCKCRTSNVLNAGTVLHEGSDGRYFDHTSLIATMRKLFPSMSQKPLTPREEGAYSFEVSPLALDDVLI